MLTSTLLYGLLAAASTVDAHAHPKPPKASISYSVVPGIFLQDDNATNPTGFDFIATNFGLINRTYPSDSSCPDRGRSTQWQRLAHYIDTLNSEGPKGSKGPKGPKGPKNERYSLLFMGRHGEGFHNAAETFFGTPAWNCYWATREGNATVTWADAKLTPYGVKQTDQIKDFWARLIKNEKITAPEAYYTSPLNRCLDTAKLTFGDLDLSRKSPFEPVIKEFLREGISAHTCNRRSTKSTIKKNFPGFEFEKGFPENDPYWQSGKAEPSAAQDARSKAGLDDLFTSDDSTHISITSHSGEIASLLRSKSHESCDSTAANAIS